MQSSQAIRKDLSSIIKDLLGATFEVYFFLHKIFICHESILLQNRSFRNMDNIASAVVRVYTVAQPKFVDVLISCGME